MVFVYENIFIFGFGVGMKYGYGFRGFGCFDFFDGRFFFVRFGIFLCGYDYC